MTSHSTGIVNSQPGAREAQPSANGGGILPPGRTAVGMGGPGFGARFRFVSESLPELVTIPWDNGIFNRSGTCIDQLLPEGTKGYLLILNSDTEVLLPINSIISVSARTAPTSSSESVEGSLSEGVYLESGKGKPVIILPDGRVFEPSNHILSRINCRAMPATLDPQSLPGNRTVDLTAANLRGGNSEGFIPLAIRSSASSEMREVASQLYSHLNNFLREPSETARDELLIEVAAFAKKINDRAVGLPSEQREDAQSLLRFTNRIRQFLPGEIIGTGAELTTIQKLDRDAFFEFLKTYQSALTTFMEAIERFSSDD